MLLSPAINHIDIFGVKIYFYGIIIAISIIVCFFYLKYLSYKKANEINFEIIYDFLPILILGSIISARLYYVLINWKYYINHLSEIFMLNQGGLAIHGAILGGILILILLLKIKKQKYLNYLDIFACTLPLGQAIGRLGNYFNQEAFGLPCNYSWCLYIEPSNRPFKYYNFETFHPTFLYEMIFNFIIFIILNYLYLKQPKLKAGSFFALYLILYSTIRILIENIRIDAQIFLFQLPLPIVVSGIIIILMSIYMLNNFKQKI